ARRLLGKTVVRAAAGRVPVIIHTGAITTAATIELTLHAQAVGAVAAAVMPPFYFRHSDAALMAHYLAVTQAAPKFRFYLYNFPFVSNNTLSFELVTALMAKAPNVVGMKDSSGSLELLARLSAVTGGAFNTANGGDGQILAAQALGLDACVSGNANVVPELVVALYEAAAAGDLPRARLLQQKLNRVRDLLGDGGDLSTFKQMVARRGVPVGDVRAPLLPAKAEVVEARWQELLALDVEMSPVQALRTGGKRRK
nr:dihydrodipicolinate synthase family protein [Caldilineaceae bacterium]